METGELGLPLELAMQLAEEELKLAPEFATTPHLPTEELLALALLLKVQHAIHNPAVKVNKPKRAMLQWEGCQKKIFLKAFSYIPLIF